MNRKLKELNISLSLMNLLHPSYPLYSQTKTYSDTRYNCWYFY